ncbi:hypothetical protein [Seonamhaeicola sp.]|uniref:hypothetical protein n=1 Tax=Seonamhaeicola sp. TaxID=1912245 RepID=UPI00262AE646|nr:hypothetical protein [Seonamhaeicola sp.]
MIAIKHIYFLFLLFLGFNLNAQLLNPNLLVISAAGQAVSEAHEFMNPGVYLSKDGGGSWTKINKELGQPDKIVDVKPDPYNEDVLWCASWGCGWFVAYLNDSKAPWLKE